MHFQVLSSGSKGNSSLIRVGEMCLLIDAGLPIRGLRERFEAARTPFRGIDHILVTHAHLDHSRSAGALAKSHGATVHCAEGNMRFRSFSRAPKFQTLSIGSEYQVCAGLSYKPVTLPHDCDPTVAFRIESNSRVVVVLTDMGHPNADVARALSGAHVLLLEFNHDTQLLNEGPYPAALKRRIAGAQGHLSNSEAGEMLRRMAGEELHTLILAHLSRENNTPELARSAAQEILAEAGLEHVNVLVASQDEIGPNIEV